MFLEPQHCPTVPNTKSRFWSKKNLIFEAKIKIWGFWMLAISNFGVSNRNSKGIGKNDFEFDFVVKFRVQGLGILVLGFSGVDFRVQGLEIFGFRVFRGRFQGLGLWFYGFQVPILGFRVKGFETPISKFGIGFSEVDF